MLKELMKALGKGEKAEEVIQPEQEASTESIVAEGELVVEAVTEELVANTDFALLQAEFDLFKQSAADAASQAAAQVAELVSKLDEANAALAAIAAEKAAMAAEAEAKRLAARKEKVEAAIGTEKAAGLLLATEGLDDAAFNAVVSALAGSVEAEAETELFKEVGVTAEADAAKVVTESAEMKILKQKYQSK